MRKVIISNVFYSSIFKEKVEKHQYRFISFKTKNFLVLSDSIVHKTNFEESK